MDLRARPLNPARIPAIPTSGLDPNAYDTIWYVCAIHQSALP